MAHGKATASDQQREQDRRTRIQLCNEWDLVPAEDLRNANHLNESIIADLTRRLEVAEGRA